MKKMCSNCRYLTYEDPEFDDAVDVIWICTCDNGCAKENGTYDDYYKEE